MRPLTRALLAIGANVVFLAVFQNFNRSAVGALGALAAVLVYLWTRGDSAAWLAVVLVVSGILYQLYVPTGSFTQMFRRWNADTNGALALAFAASLLVTFSAQPL
jgi:hypothetical protein